MVFRHHHPTFDFWHNCSGHKRHDTPPPSSSDPATSSSAASDHEVPLDTEENPQELSLVRRWLAVLCIPSASICITCASFMAVFVELPVTRRFQVAEEAAILGVSLLLCLGPQGEGPLLRSHLTHLMYAMLLLLYAFCLGPCGITR